jgi:hypothetical protein
LSAKAYEQRADSEGETAEAEEEAYDPLAGRQPDPTEHDSTCDPTGVCWTSERNPTEEHLQVADKLRQEAARDRLLSKELREAEQKSCVGVSEADRDLGPFIHVEDISSVKPLLGRDPGDGHPPLRGAIVTFRPLWGLTVDYLQRALDCHLARTNVLGNRLPEMPNCPMVTPGTEASVARTARGFAVSLSSDDPKSAQEILRRARMFLPKPGPKASSPTSAR